MWNKGNENAMALEIYEESIRSHCVCTQDSGDMNQVMGDDIP